MELDDVQSDLISLRKLYGLLQTNEDGLQNVISKTLDDKARVFLKNLLDGAAGKIFESYSKIVAAQQNVPNTPILTQLEQLKGIQNLHPSMSLRVSEHIRNTAENSSKDLNLPSVFLQNDELSAAMPMLQDSISDLSKCSTFATGPEMGKEQSWGYEQSTLKHLNSAKKAKFSREKRPILSNNSNFLDQQTFDQFGHFGWVNGHEKESESRAESSDFVKSHETRQISKIQPSPITVGSLACSSVDAATKVVKSGEREMKPVEAVDMPEEVANAIKQIESRLRSAQLADREVDPVKENKIGQSHQGSSKVRSVPTADSVDPLIQTIEAMFNKEKSEPGGADESVLPNQRVCDPVFVGCNSLGRKGDNPRKTSARPSPIDNDLRSHAHCQKCGKKKASTLLSQVPSQNMAWAAGHNSGARVDNIQPMYQSRSRNNLSSSLSYNVVKGLRILPSETGNKDENHKRIRAADSGQIPPRHNRVQDPGQRWGGSRTIGVTRKGKDLLRRTTQVPILLDYHSTAWESCGSCKPTQLDQRKKKMLHHHVSETSGSSGALSGWTTQETSTSGSDILGYSAASEGTTTAESGSVPSEGNSNSLSESEADLSPSQTGSKLVGPTSRQLSHVKGESKQQLHRLRNNHHEVKKRIPPKKTVKKSEGEVGKLKKFKDKLALIFHHHHHHHRLQGSDDGGNKSVRKGINGRDKNEAYEEHAVKKARKMVPRKGQQAQLQALVGGLVRHVKHSKKKSKVHKGSHVARPDQRSSAKKPWWQKRVKLGGKPKKPLLGPTKMK